MKKSLILLIAVFTLLTAAIAPWNISSGDAEESVPVSATSEYSTDNETELITVMEYNGKIGLFKDDEKSPFSVINVYTFILPEYDKAILKTGFKVERTGIESVIQDYTG